MSYSVQKDRTLLFRMKYLARCVDPQCFHGQGVFAKMHTAVNSISLLSLGLETHVQDPFLSFSSGVFIFTDLCSKSCFVAKASF